MRCADSEVTLKWEKSIPTVAGNAVGPAVAIVNEAPCNTVVGLMEVAVGASHGLSRDMIVRPHSRTVWSCGLHLYIVNVSVILPDGSRRLVFRHRVDFNKHNVLVVRVPLFAHWRTAVESDSHSNSCSAATTVDTTALTSRVAARTAVSVETMPKSELLRAISSVTIASRPSSLWAIHDGPLKIAARSDDPLSAIRDGPLLHDVVQPCSDDTASNAACASDALTCVVSSSEATGIGAPSIGDPSLVVEAHSKTAIAAVVVPSSSVFEWPSWFALVIIERLRTAGIYGIEHGNACIPKQVQIQGAEPSHGAPVRAMAGPGHVVAQEISVPDVKKRMAPARDRRCCFRWPHTALSVTSWSWHPLSWHPL